MNTKQTRRVRAAFAAVSFIYMRLPEAYVMECNLPGERGAEARGKLNKMIAAIPKTVDEAELLISQNDSAILAFLESWTIDKTLPKSVDDIGELSDELSSALAEAVSEPASALLSKTLKSDGPVPNTPEFADHPFGESSDSSTPSPTEENPTQQ
ncbi:MAG: hypothetical protein KGL39_45805 [Patescibacteria group bacterium]|nr:hypothetical protein [Patescibacteria group bacterium]